MQELRQRTEATDPGLTTADLAHLDETTSSENTRQETETDQSDRAGRRDFLDTSRRESLELNGAATTNGSTGSTTVDRGSVGRASGSGDTTQAAQNETATPLFSPEEAKEFHSRWDAIQVSFVDEPRQAVQQADSLVANAMKRLAEIFAQERGDLDQQWDRGSEVSTEDLRVALRRYRSFFGRLLSV